jgi:hypothetical protein
MLKHVASSKRTCEQVDSENDAVFIRKHGCIAVYSGIACGIQLGY